jgi:two-component system response regulator FixJ
MGGLKLLAAVKKMAPWVPVLITSGHGDVRTTAAAFREGAVDFLEKPISKQTLLSAVTSGLGQMVFVPDLLRGRQLTSAEAEVLSLILDGKTNSEIAYTRRRSRRTIEDQRRSIMFKLGADNIVDLVKKSILMGLLGPTSNRLLKKLKKL